LFDVVVVSARKPDFFTSKMPVYEVVSAGPQVAPLGGGPLAATCGDGDDNGGDGGDGDGGGAALEPTDQGLAPSTWSDWAATPSAAAAAAAPPSGADASRPATLLQEVFGMARGRVYQGGTASMVEKLFNVTSTDRILYVGDHVFTDVSIAKVCKGSCLYIRVVCSPTSASPR
jgi:hypothetical protein